MKINFVERIIGSGLYTGYIPFASGTFGSAAALMIFLIPGFERPEIIIPVILFFIFYGIYIGTKFEKVYGKDPSECTIDEFVGMWISLIFVPKKLIILIIGFVIWRIMDILKPFPAGKLESIDGGLGIMLDDIVSAIYSLILIQIILYFL